MNIHNGISVITACLNEQESIGELLESLNEQTQLPSELIIADGGSTDGTLTTIKNLTHGLAFPVRVLCEPGKIAEGRNKAIAHAGYEIIAVTDADCKPSKEWLSSLTLPLREGKANAAAGGYYALATSPMERAIATFTWVPLTMGTKRFLPSHRSVAFLKSVWRSIGGYNTQIDSGEDTLFDLQIEKDFGFAYIPAATVAWKPRRSLKAALRQQLFYGGGDGQAKIQLLYHGAIALFVIAELLVFFPQTRVAAAVLLLATLLRFVWKHLQLFPHVWPDWVNLAALMFLLPPARLAGFVLGFMGLSMRRLLHRS